MDTNILVLPDGTELSSGRAGENAIASLTLTACVNEDKELTLGSVCAAQLAATVLLENACSIQAGQELTLYRQDSLGNREKLGIFITEKPKRTGINTLKLTAYDRVSLLDRDLTPWLASLEGWPYTLADFARLAGQACGVEVDTGELLSGDLPVGRFTASGVSGRQLLRWAGQAGGRFLYADPEGVLRFAWYTDRGNQIAPTGEEFYYQGTLQYEDYEVQPVQKIQLRQTQQDVGTVYPDTEQERNTYCITGNPLLQAENSETLLPVAQRLYALLEGFSYRPCSVEIPGHRHIRAGELICVTDSHGTAFVTCAMTVKTRDQRTSVQCTGSRSRGSTDAFHSLSYKALSGRVLNLQTTVDGIRAENKDAQGRVASLELSVTGLKTQVQGCEQDIAVLDQHAYGVDIKVRAMDEQLQCAVSRTAELELTAQGIRSQVSCQQEEQDLLRQEMTTLQQDTRQVELTVESIQQQGAQQVTTATGFTLNADGLRIKKEGQQMENLLTDTGMYVSREDTVVLQADQDGVKATDVTVNNYLIIGSNSRFEDHTDADGKPRTACFWIG